MTTKKCSTSDPWFTIHKRGKVDMVQYSNLQKDACDSLERCAGCTWVTNWNRKVHIVHYSQMWKGK